MLDISTILIDEFSLQSWQVRNALTLHAEGATVPFIARYRKERTGELNEIQLRDLFERYTYLTELQERKGVILASIEEQGKLTNDLRMHIEACMKKTELEDLYLPYRPRRRTRATIAREKGLEPLAEIIVRWNTAETRHADLHEAATRFINPDAGVATPEDALAGASDILAEQVAERADLRAWVRTFLTSYGRFRSRMKEDLPEGSTRYEMYRDFTVSVRDIAPHNMLAIRRGEAEGILALELLFEENTVVSYIEDQTLRSAARTVREFWCGMCRDAFERLMKHTLIGEVRYEKKIEADLASIRTFGDNLRELLLASPAGMKATLGIDPGFRTGCKAAAIDNTGKFLEYQTLYAHSGENSRRQAVRQLLDLVQRHGIELIAIGNGTAGRETQQFAREALAELHPGVVIVMVNEAGASVYSASETAIDEFPELDITVRGAISIARRLQDPLAELVKIEPKSIGVGQYQHDVDQRLLRKKLDETVESCVNHVGVDINLASRELLSHVSGLTPALARNIIQHRNERGAFRNRTELLKVGRFGPKAFEQCAGFLRIRDAEHPLDNTAVHPESYYVVETIARDMRLSMDRITDLSARVRDIDIKRYVSEAVGEPTLRDILYELEKPGRDPRDNFNYAEFREDVNQLSDLSVGMELQGVVTNVTNFGAFVDIGVHQDGLIHISQMADSYVEDPRSVVRVGQTVTVRVLEVNEQLRRIALSMKRDDSLRPSRGRAQSSLDDLKAKFNRK
jgi:protein Tex